MFSKKDLGDTENMMEDQIEGTEDNEPGNQNATTSTPFPSRKISRKPKTPFPVSDRDKGGPSVPSKHGQRRPAARFIKSKSKNRSTKAFKKGVKHPPTVQQKMKSFGGLY